jgi:outer membrane lipopolysaccharide assembly protein LptE/RlpB
MIIQLLLLILVLVGIGNCGHNPGAVIQIPSNFSLPHININVPQNLPSIILKKLELHNNCLIEVVYNWKLINDRFVISL